MISKHFVFVFVFICLYLISVTTANSLSSTNTREKRRIHLPALGLGPYCNGCPQHYCDDDPAIVFGYCCGCAYFYDYLPIKCAQNINCPLNSQKLCEDYEYMMHCCCEKK